MSASPSVEASGARLSGAGLGALVLAALLLSGENRFHDVRMPPPAVSAESVAEFYLHAAVQGECGITAQLTADRHTFSWCTDPPLLTYRDVRPPLFSAPGPGQPAEEVVAFDMDTGGSSDGSIPPGWEPWSLCLIRTPDGWRVYDQGQG